MSNFYLYFLGSQISLNLQLSSLLQKNRYIDIEKNRYIDIERKKNRLYRIMQMRKRNLVNLHVYASQTVKKKCVLFWYLVFKPASIRASLTFKLL
jgi:hypothetical protein